MALDHFPFLRLPKEIRLDVYELLVSSERPFLIGRWQDDKRYQRWDAHPREYFTANLPKELKEQVHRDDTPSLPIQPAISRTCRSVRVESLAVFHNINEFWLVHNKMDCGKPWRQQRGFATWVQQTVPDSLAEMNMVQLCGYDASPNHVVLRLNLKKRQALEFRRYTSFGEELDTSGEGVVADINQFMTGKDDYDSSELLRAVLRRCDWMFRLDYWLDCRRWGSNTTRLVASGVDFDW